MLKTAYSPYWLILCVLVGLAYAYLLYSRKKEPWSSKWNKLLFGLRCLVVSIIGYLFLEPFISIQKTASEPSKIIFLWDNSESLAKGESNLQSYWRDVKKLQSDLQIDKEVDIPIVGFRGKELSDEDSVQNTLGVSPMNNAIKNIGSNFDKELISEVIVFSDGVYNQGISPDYYAFPFQVSTVGLGDTSQKQDVILQQVRYNKVAYEGNLFPIEADIIQRGFSGQKVQVKLKKNQEVLSQEILRFQQDQKVETVRFLIDAQETGFQGYELEVEVLEREHNVKNNAKNIYVNIIAGKKNVLLLAPYPHPDIKALSASISGNDNYKLTMAIEGISDSEVENLQQFDLVILFHLPNINNSFDSEIRQLEKQAIPMWFITGAQTNLAKHNALNQSVDLVASSQTDEAFVYVNSDFDLFELNGEQDEVLEGLPPVSLPFANHKFHPLSKQLFYKKVGNVKTEAPVFIFYNNNDIRQATLLAQNFRTWRMVEYLNNQNHNFFNEWVMKTIRYLTAKNQKDRFKVFPVKEAFADNEEIKFQVEIYNEVYDRIYGSPVNLSLVSSKDSTINFEFTPDRLNPDFVAGNLPGGIYEYKAFTALQGKEFESEGQFVVEEFALESQNLQADFSLLRRVAAKNQGDFFYASQMDNLRQYLKAKEYPKVLTGETDKVPLTQSILPYLLVFMLVFGEWFIRRYFGSY